MVNYALGDMGTNLEDLRVGLEGKMLREQCVDGLEEGGERS